MKTAVLLKNVSKLKAPAFSKTNKKPKNEYDTGNRSIATTVGKLAIESFFRNDQFNNFTLAVPCGNYTHECCSFFRKNNEVIDAIFYNPSYSDVTRGVRSNKVVKELLKSLSLGNIQSYYSPCGNVDGRCSALVWVEIHKLVINGDSPFINGANLEDYSRFMTLHTFRKHWAK